MTRALVRHGTAFRILLPLLLLITPLTLPFPLWGWGGAGAGGQWGVPLAWAQMEQPLKGQGVDPVTAGLVNESVPVYVSISLEKLHEVDEKGYTFSAVFTIVMTWRMDPRINETVNLLNFLGSDSKATRQQQLRNCLEKAALTGGSNSADCKAALAGDNAGGDGGCKRPCFMGNGFACCDSVWLPGFNIPNVLFMSQDRIVLDEVWLYGSTVGAYNNDWGAVYRVVRLHGIFSNLFNFRTFPFDSQSLQFQMSPIPPANFHIVPSYVGRSILGPYGLVFQNDARAFASLSGSQSGNAKFASDQVTGWSFAGDEAVSMCCEGQCASAGDAPSDTFDPTGFNQSDPQYLWFGNRSASNESSITGLTCVVCVSIDRLTGYYIANDIIPVLVTGLLAFTVVFARPDDLDIRLSTLVTLFLALVAVQFVIADQLPHTSYLTSFAYLVLIAYAVIVLLILESLFVFYISVVEANHKKKRAALTRLEEKKYRPWFTSWYSAPKPKPEEGVEAPATGESNGEITPASAASARLRSHLPDEEAGTDALEALNSDLDGAPPPNNVQTKASNTRILFRPFAYTEATFLRLVENGDSAFHIATLVDNVSLVILGIGFIVGSILAFTLVPEEQTMCSL